MVGKKALGLATILAVMPLGTQFAFAAPFTLEDIQNATFESWQGRLQDAAAVLKIDQASGDVETVEDTATKDADDTATVAVPGQPDAVVEIPQQSTDVPDEAAAQVTSDPEVRQEVANAAKEARAEAAEDQDEPDPFLVRVQVMLDHAYTSPGVIDGLLGGNTRKAVEAYRTINGLTVNGEIDSELWDSLSKNSVDLVQTYELTQEDIDGRYVDTVPDDYADLAELDWIGYHDVPEMLAERFHMDEDLLKLLNPDADFSSAGTKIDVVVAGGVPEGEARRIVVDKGKGELRAYGEDEDKPLFVAPATIGSDDTPSPSGEVDVVAVVREPTYTYDPDENFQQGDNTEKMQIAPGPNGPVGNIWIDLSKPTYGIHGTPEPSLISKSASHGCVRLTNWDAGRLAELVKPEETHVEFTD